VSLIDVFCQVHSPGNSPHRQANQQAWWTNHPNTLGELKMKTSQILAAAALTLLAATGAQAETYQGVNTAVSTKSRDDVNAEAVRAASAPNQNVTRGSRGPETVAVSKDRSLVEAEAVRTAYAPEPERDLGFAREQQGDLEHAAPDGRERPSPARLGRRRQVIEAALRGRRN
jgi:hypothetical protein